MASNPILDDFNKIKQACKELSGKKVLVGMVGGDGSDILKIAHSHEYGDGKMPERSFIRASFDANSDKLGEIVSTEINKVLSKKTTPSAAANSIGAQASQIVQNFIDDNRVKPQSDFSKKSQHTTLYETGTHIRDRITFKVVNKE